MSSGRNSLLTCVRAQQSYRSQNISISVFQKALHFFFYSLPFFCRIKIPDLITAWIVCLLSMVREVLLVFNNVALSAYYFYPVATITFNNKQKSVQRVRVSLLLPLALSFFKYLLDVGSHFIVLFHLCGARVVQTITQHYMFKWDML